MLFRSRCGTKKKIQIFPLKIFPNLICSPLCLRCAPARVLPHAFRILHCCNDPPRVRVASASVTTPRPRVHARAFMRPEHYSRAQSIIHAPKREFHVKQTFSYSKKKQKFLHNDIYILLDSLHSIFIFYNTGCVFLLF